MQHRSAGFTPTNAWSRPASRAHPVVAGQDRRPSAVARRQGRLARWGMAIVFLLFAYEWFISGLDKVLSPDFRSGLVANLRDSMKGNPNHWYVDWLNTSIIPHAHSVAITIEVGELLVALGFVLGVVLWLWGAQLSLGWRRLLHGVVLVTLLASAFMAANYYFLMGEGVPWLKTGDPFDEGLSIDGLLTLISLALFILMLIVWPRRVDRDDRAVPGEEAGR